MSIESARGGSRESFLDSFVEGIVRSRSLEEEGERGAFIHTRVSEREEGLLAGAVVVAEWTAEHHRTVVNSRQNIIAGARGANKRNCPSSRSSGRALQVLFGYSLIFINFTFIMASLLLIMSGIVAAENAAVRLCRPCGYIGMTALVFGIILWIFTIFGFIWIRKRQMVFLLVYVGFLVLLFLVLAALIITAAVYDRETRVSLMDPSKFVNAWERGVNDTKNGINYDICLLQKRYNCSGFRDGCCLADVCYNVSDAPVWVESLCPLCPSFPPMTPVTCTDVVYSTVRRNLNGFLVISIFAMLLVVTGILFAFISRRANRLMMINAA